MPTNPQNTESVQTPEEVAADVIAQLKPLPKPAPETPPAVSEDTPPATVSARAWHLVNMAGALVFAFVLFYLLADWSSFSTGQYQMGQLVFSNTMTQLYTAAYRAAFIIGVSIGLQRVFIPDFFHFWRADKRGGPDAETTFRYQLTPYQRLCVFLFTFFGFCYLLVELLQVSLPESVSVGR